MPEVKINVEISAWEGLLSVERFLPVLQRFADIFEMDLVAHVPKEMATPREGDPRIMYIHFFYRTTTGSVNESSVSEIFGLASSRPLRCWRSPPSQGLLFTLKDFKGTLLAHRDQRSIFIDFDFLQNSWDGHGDVLELILWYLLSPHTTTIRAGDRMAEDLQSRFSGRREKEAASFNAFFSEALEASLAYGRSGIALTDKKITETEEAFMAAMREVRELDEYLQWLPDRLPSDEDLGKEFEAILDLPEISRIHVSFDPNATGNSDGEIRLTTRRLTQRIPPPPKKGESYDIGSFLITIYPFETFKPSTAVPNTVRVTQKEKGPYRKLYLDAQSCLGNQTTTGLNYAAAQLFAEVAIPPLVQLVLTFLKYDTKVPPKVSEDELRRMRGWTPEPPEVLSEGERRHERERYIQLVKTVRQSRLSGVAVQRLAELNKKSAADLEELGQLRRRREELKLFLRFLKEKLSRIKEEAPRVFQEVISHPYVKGIEVCDGLRLWLCGEEIRFPRLLWVSNSGILRLLSVERFKGEGQAHNINFDEPGEEEAVRKFLIGGDYAKALPLIIGQIKKPPYDYSGYGG